MKGKVLSFIVLLTLFFSCTIGPKPIVYGTDVCCMCRMKIMDTKFGAEIVTKKGVAFKFDCDECLMAYINTGTLKPELTAMILVTDFSNPGNLITAENAFYLHSDKVQSPMGAGISSFKTKEAAQKVNIQNGDTGEIVSWTAIQEIRKSH